MHIYICQYLHLPVNYDKIMQECWDFDVSSAQTWRLSALDKHQNWSEGAFFVTILEIINVGFTWDEHFFWHIVQSLLNYNLGYSSSFYYLA